MDGGEDQIILVEQRHAGLVAGGVGRIEGELGEEALAARERGGDLRELRKVALAHRRVLVDAVEMRQVPLAHEIELGWPAGGLAARQLEGAGELRPVRRAGGGRL